MTCVPALCLSFKPCLPCSGVARHTKAFLGQSRRCSGRSLLQVKELVPAPALLQPGLSPRTDQVFPHAYPVRTGRERALAACRVPPAWGTRSLNVARRLRHVKMRSGRKGILAQSAFGQHQPGSGTTRGPAQQAGPRSRRGTSVACLHLLLLPLFRPSPLRAPPFREEFLQPDDSSGLAVAQDFRFACSLSKLPHELPARSARQDNPSIRLDSDNFSDGALPVCYHAGNGISFCTHAQGTGGINADADMDVPVS